MIFFALIAAFCFGMIAGGLYENYRTKKKCRKCGSRNLKRGTYTTGYNTLCQQASGDPGSMCDNCGHIEFDLSLHVRTAIKEKYTPWVTINR